jgi:hypothetical protein
MRSIRCSEWRKPIFFRSPRQASRPITQPNKGPCIRSKVWKQSDRNIGEAGKAEETGLRLLFQRRFFRWRSNVLKLNCRLRQNSLRRIPLLMNSATNC